MDKVTRRHLFQILIIVGLTAFASRFLDVSWTSAYAVRNMSLFETEAMRNKCVEIKDVDCTVAAYRRLIQLQPNEPSHQEHLDALLEAKKKRFIFL